MRSSKSKVGESDEGGVAGEPMAHYVQAVFTDLAQNVATDSESFTVQVQPVLGECEGCVSVAGASAYVDKGVYRNDFGASPIKKTGVYTLSVFSAGGACSTPRRCLSRWRAAAPSIQISLCLDIMKTLNSRAPALHCAEQASSASSRAQVPSPRPRPSPPVV